MAYSLHAKPAKQQFGLFCHTSKLLAPLSKTKDKGTINGEKDLEEFWIDFRGRKIQKSYYALRNEQKEYMGVLEVSQEITEIQKRKGEKSLASE